jgi:site-specific recombinase XerD
MDGPQMEADSWVLSQMKANIENPSETISPRQARKQFLSARRGNVKQSTHRAYKFPTRHLVEFSEKHGVESIGEIGGYLIESWKQDRKEDVKQITLHANVKTVRVFIRWCESAELVEYGTADRIEIPEVTREQEVCNDKLPLAQAESILRYLDTYEYGSRQHALFKTMWHTGCRISGAISLDKKDFEHSDGPILKFRNRVTRGTPLKNRNQSERNVTINDDLQTVLRDYLGKKRCGVTDDFDREPLFTTETQRLERQRAYKNFTALTRPCVIDGECPHDREIDHCDAAKKKKHAFGCPSSQSLHPIRRGAITYHINRGWPKEKLAERVDVSVDVLNKHYDARSKEEERQGRKQHLDLL